MLFHSNHSNFRPIKGTTQTRKRYFNVEKRDHISRIIRKNAVGQWAYCEKLTGVNQNTIRKWFTDRDKLCKGNKKTNRIIWTAGVEDILIIRLKYVMKRIQLNFVTVSCCAKEIAAKMPEFDEFTSNDLNVVFDINWFSRAKQRIGLSKVNQHDDAVCFQSCDFSRDITMIK